MGVSGAVGGDTTPGWGAASAGVDVQRAAPSEA
jgi:hypothetical protein